MSLSKEDLNQISEHVKSHLTDWLETAGVSIPRHLLEMELRERIVRVEEELKNQRELMRQGFEHVEKRFEQVDKRFEQVDKRFEDINGRFNMMFVFMTIGFTLLVVVMSVYKFVN